MKSAIQIILFISYLLASLALIYTGFIYQKPFGAIDTGFIPMGDINKSLAESAQAWYQSSPLYAEGDVLGYNETGLKTVMFAATGALTVAYMVLATLIAVVFREKPPGEETPEDEDEKKIAAPEKKAEAAPAAGETVDIDLPEDPADKPPLTAVERAKGVAAFMQGGYKEQADSKKPYLIPDFLLDDEMGDRLMFYNINKSVSMTQSNMTLRKIAIVIYILRPDMVEVISKLPSEIKTIVARQIINFHTLRLKRDEEGLSADQYNSQNKRMREAERDTICRRFMPKSEEDLNELGREIVGHVYSLQEYLKVQQKTHTESDDWADISIRNIVDVMRQETIIENPAPQVDEKKEAEKIKSAFMGAYNDAAEEAKK